MPEEKFDEGLEEVKERFFKLDPIGAKVIGVLVNKETRLNRLNGKDQAIYTLVLNDNSTIRVAGRYWNKEKTCTRFPIFDELPLGSVCGVEYIGDKKADKPGMNDQKLLKFFKGKFRGDVLEKYQTGAEEVTEEPDLNA